MRTSVVCLMVVVLLSAVAPLAAYAQEESANPPAVSPPQAVAEAPSGSAQASSSFLDIDLYLSLQEVIQILARMGAIPQDVAARALAESKASAAPGDGPASYVKVTVHLRLSEIAPLAAAMGQARARAVATRRPAMRQEPPAAAREPTAATPRPKKPAK
jgi:hypothetical protein